MGTECFYENQAAEKRGRISLSNMKTFKTAASGRVAVYKSKRKKEGSSGRVQKSESKGKTEKLE